MSDPFLGEIRFVGFNFAPVGWSLCAGQLLPISQNEALYTLFGTTYGGDGVQTFGLPDLQGRTPVGPGNGRGLTPVVAGQKAGTESVSLNVNQLPMHNHLATVTTGPLSVSLTASIGLPAVASAAGATGTPGTTTIFGTGSSQAHPVTDYNTATATDTLLPFSTSASGTFLAPVPVIGNAGGSLPVDIEDPYLGLTMIVSLEGIFPSRS